MTERNRNIRPIIREKYLHPFGVGIGAQFIAKADEVATGSPSPISDVIRFTQAPKIPEKVDLINWYGSDLAGPFALYYFLRTVGSSRPTAVTISSVIPFMFEFLEYSTRNATISDDGGRYDPIDLGCYTVSIAGAVVLDKWLNRSPKIIIQPATNPRSTSKEHKVKKQKSRKSRRRF